MVEGLWKVFLWLLDRCKDLLALMHRPVAAITQAVLEGIGNIGKGEASGAAPEEKGSGESASLKDTDKKDII